MHCDKSCERTQPSLSMALTNDFLTPVLTKLFSVSSKHYYSCSGPWQQNGCLLQDSGIFPVCCFQSAGYFQLESEMQIMFAQAGLHWASLHTTPGAVQRAETQEGPGRLFRTSLSSGRTQCWHQVLVPGEILNQRSLADCSHAKAVFEGPRAQFLLAGGVLQKL